MQVSQNQETAVHKRPPKAHVISRSPLEQGILVTKKCIVGYIPIFPVARIAGSGFHMIAHKFFYLIVPIAQIEQSYIVIALVTSISPQLSVTVSIWSPCSPGSLQSLEIVYGRSDYTETVTESWVAIEVTRGIVIAQIELYPIRTIGTIE